MTELDDAVARERAKRDSAHATKRKEAEARRLDMVAEGERIERLAAEFLVRMAKRGNPGTVKNEVHLRDRGVLGRRTKGKYHAAWVLAKPDIGAPKRPRVYLLTDGRWYCRPPGGVHGGAVVDVSELGVSYDEVKRRVVQLLVDHNA